MGLQTLAPVVFELYNNALATSSKKSYKTGTNHFHKFQKAFPGLNTVCVPTPPPSKHILTLCFFAVSLFLKKSIKSANTIRSYVRHVKKLWIQNGCKPELLKSDVLDRVLKGLKRQLPPKKRRETGVPLAALQAPAKISAPCKRKTLLHDGGNYFWFFRSFSIPYFETNEYQLPMFGRQKRCSV